MGSAAGPQQVVLDGVLPTSFAQRSYAVARRFLHSVVVIDDRAYLDPTSASESSKAPDARDPLEATDTAALSAPSDEFTLPVLVTPQMEPESSERDLDAKALVDAFAVEGLICAVLKPGPRETVAVLAGPVARRADIVVMDWYLHGDYGAQTLAGIASILDADEESGGRTRLIVIFTAQGELARIAREVAEVLATRYTNSPLDQPDDFTLRKGPVRVAVFAKPGARVAEGDTEVAGRRVSEAQLPIRVIGEFTQANAGLVANSALAALTQLRDATHLLLKRAHSGLDPGYLWHRAMQVHPTEAEDHLVGLLADELRAILEDGSVGGEARLEVCAEWLAQEGLSIDYGPRFGVNEPRSLQEVIQLLSEGAGQPRNTKKPVLALFPSMKEGQKPHWKPMRAFASSPEENERRNAALARLMTFRPHYGRPIPYLTLGTVLSTQIGTKTEYWLCMQPRCDSVRLAEPTGFPLMRLDMAAEESRTHVVLEQPSGTFQGLALRSEPASLKVVEFAVTGSLGTVSALTSADNRRYFEAVDGSQFFWHGELKADHAQWMVHELVKQFGRIGRVESEWLRLRGK
jgi:hypothetical protein